MNQTNLFEKAPAPTPARRRRGERWRLALFGLLALALVADSAAVCWNTWQLERDTPALERRRQAVTQGRELLLDLQEASLSRRGYILTGDRAYLNHYLGVLTALNPHLQRFQRDAGDTPAQKARLAGLESAIRGLAKLWQNSITHYQLQPKDTPQHALLTRQAGELLERVRAETEQLSAAPDQWLDAHRAVQAARVRTVYNLGLAQGALALAMGLLGTMAILRRRREDPAK